MSGNKHTRIGCALVGLLLACGLLTMHSVSAHAQPATPEAATGHAWHHTSASASATTGETHAHGGTTAHSGCDGCGGHTTHATACTLAPTKPAAGQMVPPADLPTRPDAPVPAPTEPTTAVERWSEARRPSLTTLSISRT